MANQEWKWADLDSEQLGMLKEGEQTLGADILLAYQPEQGSPARTARALQRGLQVAGLNESQLECLQGLEKNMQAVVVAYRQASS